MEQGNSILQNLDYKLRMNSPKLGTLPVSFGGTDYLAGYLHDVDGIDELMTKAKTDVRAARRVASIVTKTINREFAILHREPTHPRN